MGNVRGKDGAHNEREKEVIKRTEEKVKEESVEEVKTLEEGEKYEKAVAFENALELTKSKETKLQWHPAFYAEIQIELEEEAWNLVFENEHQLGTKPKEVDILVVKKNENIPIQKNIGRLFRKHNIIEYKSPDDTLGINDFYKVLGYSYFYKADTKEENVIRIEELTVTFVCRRYPRKLIKHLKQQGDKVLAVEPGIFYIKGEKVPVQLIVTSRLSEEKNFWLKNLTDDLKSKRTAGKIVEEYDKHKNDIYYRSVMDIIVRANRTMFREEYGMCDAMMEILKDRIDVLEQKAREDGEKLGKREGKNEGIRLTKMIMRMDAEGLDCVAIAEKCLITVEEVKEILAA